MRSKFILAIGLGLLLLTLLVVFPRKEQPASNKPGTNLAASTVTVVVAVSPTSNYTPVPLVTTPPPPRKPPPTSLPFPVEELVPLPTELKDVSNLIMRRAGKASLLSENDALQAVSNMGVPFVKGGQYLGKTVTIKSYYGLVTIGSPNSKGEWVGGPVNIPLQTCSASNQCTPTGKVLDRIENRPMWLLDYGNVAFKTSGIAGPPYHHNHSAYLVDEETKKVLLVIGYTGS